MEPVPQQVAVPEGDLVGCPREFAGAVGMSADG
jgi:hypothetical protein